MEKFMNWMTKTVAPKMEKVGRNPWLYGLQQAINKVLPLILVGSIITVYNVLRNYAKSLPNLTDIRSYTFGLISIFMVFFIPYFIMENKKHQKVKYIAGMSGISLFMILVNPKIVDAGYIYNFSYFGAGGMFVAIVAGIFVAIIMNLFANFSFFKENSAMPGFIQQWFDSLIPIIIVVFVGWLLVIQFKLDIYQMIVSIFTPLVGIAQTYPGMLLLYLIPTVFYSMGISGWVFSPILTPIALSAIAANAAVGASATNIFCDEVVFALIALGGRGCTLPLSVLMLKAKSKKMKVLGKTTIGPSILNINEPVVYGAIAWNPMLMIPMWIIAIVTVTLTYVSMYIFIFINKDRQQLLFLS